MKKSILLILVFCIATISFGQKHIGITSTNTAFTFKAQMNSDIQNLKNPSPVDKVFWTPSSGTKLSYLTQNFDGTWLPSGWTQTILLTTQTWMHGNASTLPFSTIDPTSVFSAICPYSLSTTSIQDEWLISPSITGTSSASSLILNFYAGFSYDWLPGHGGSTVGADLQCKISNNGGSTWTVIWDALNYPFFTGWVWHDVTVDISAYKNTPFIIAWNVTGADGDGFGLDNIYVIEPAAVDVGVTKIKAPLSSCTNLSASENVIVQIKNYGTTAITGFPVSYKIDNNTPVTVTYTGSILPGDTADYIFTGANAADLSAFGNYIFQAYTGATGDALLHNDTITAYICSGPASVPYSIGFEANENFAGWTMTDANADGYCWLTYIGTNYAHTGQKFAAYAANLNGTTAADDWLFTKCLNLIAGNAYQLKFYYKALDSYYPEALNVNIGQTNTPSGMTYQIADLPYITDTTYPSSTSLFAVPLSGTYFIGFHCKSAANRAYLFIDDITVVSLTNIAENMEPNNISIYPNPATNYIVIETQQKATFEILNVQGQLVKALESAEGNTSIDVSDLPDGVYILKVKTDKEIATKKFIKQ